MTETTRTDDSSGTHEPLSARLDLAAWPGRERRAPTRADRAYLTLGTLARQIGDQVDRRYAGRRDLRVLDVGCGAKPYLPLVAHRASSYRGIDSVPGPYVDDVGSAEDLPYADGSFDLVLCTQVLEHLHRPEAALAEIHRVLAPGGTALCSTHGVYLYHPDPPGSGQDFWRWTHSGLELLFRRAGSWRQLDVLPQGDVVVLLATLVCWHLDGLFARLRLRRLGRAAISAVNALAERLDPRFPPTIRHPEPGSLVGNYLVAATK